MPSPKANRISGVTPIVGCTLGMSLIGYALVGWMSVATVIPILGAVIGAIVGAAVGIHTATRR